MARNTLKCVSIMTQHDNNGEMRWLTVKFWRKDRSRYYTTETLSDASFQRVGRFLYANGKPQFNRSTMAVDWYNSNEEVWK